MPLINQNQNTSHTNDITHWKQPLFLLTFLWPLVYFFHRVIFPNWIKWWWNTMLDNIPRQIQLSLYKEEGKCVKAIFFREIAESLLLGKEKTQWTSGYNFCLFSLHGYMSVLEMLSWFSCRISGLFNQKQDICFCWVTKWLFVTIHWNWRHRRTLELILGLFSLCKKPCHIRCILNEVVFLFKNCYLQLMYVLG